MMGTGSALMLALIALAFLVWRPSADPIRRERHATRCTRDVVISVMLLCGQRVEYVNPDGSRVSIGSASDLEKTHSHVLMAVR